MRARHSCFGAFLSRVCVPCAPVCNPSSSPPHCLQVSDARDCGGHGRDGAAVPHVPMQLGHANGHHASKPKRAYRCRAPPYGRIVIPMLLSRSSLGGQDTSPFARIRQRAWFPAMIQSLAILCSARSTTRQCMYGSCTCANPLQSHPFWSMHPRPHHSSCPTYGTYL